MPSTYAALTGDPVLQFYALGVLTGIAAGAAFGWLARSFSIAARGAVHAPLSRGATRA